VLSLRQSRRRFGRFFVRGSTPINKGLRLYARGESQDTASEGSASTVATLGLVSRIFRFLTWGLFDNLLNYAYEIGE